MVLGDAKILEFKSNSSYVRQGVISDKSFFDLWFKLSHAEMSTDFSEVTILNINNFIK